MKRIALAALAAAALFSGAAHADETFDSFRDFCVAGRGASATAPGKRIGAAVASGSVTSLGPGLVSGSGAAPESISLASSAIRSSDFSWPSGI